MKKYKCVRKCYFLNRVFEKGERFDAPPSLGAVPKHFVEVPDAAPVVVEENREITSFHQMNQIAADLPKNNASDVKFEADWVAPSVPDKKKK
jgi:hypothetical protein